MAWQAAPARGAISFSYLAEIAVGVTARVDLCRAADGPRAGQLLAVKRLHPHIAEDQGFQNQFLDEVWLTSSLKHPNVVEVAGWGTDDQGAYLAVELVQGVSLARLMKTVFETGEVFTERMVVFIASRLCAGLAAAHALRAPNGELLNLVHRDLTPGNVLAGFNGELKIADFGLAKAKQRLTRTLTGLLKGEPQYMAPEQARGRGEIDGRADLFSLGVTLFELFAGRRPWLAANDFEMVQLTANHPPADLRELRPKLDKELAALVQRLLEKDPAARYQTAAEAGTRLQEWLSVHGYSEGNEEALARFVRRNAMRQMRWFERAVAGQLSGPFEPGSAPAPPPVPSYSDLTGKPMGALLEGRAPADDEATDLTNPERMVRASQANIAPVIRLAAEPGAPGGPGKRGSDPELPPGFDPTGDVDWGEEVPTTVQKDSVAKELMRLRARAGASPGQPGLAQQAPRPPRPGVLRALRGALPALPRILTPGPQAAPDPGAGRRAVTPGAHAVPDSGGRRAATPGPQAAPDPGAGRRQAPVTPAPPRPRLLALTFPVDEDTDLGTTAVKAKAALVPEPPTQDGPTRKAPPKAPQAAPTLPGTIAATSAGVPAPPLRRPLPGPAEGYRAEDAPARPPSSRPPSRSSPPPTPVRVFEAPGAAAREPSPAPPAAVLSEETVRAESDRLAIEAVRRAEEARAAMQRAERLQVVARLAGEAAQLGADALRLASSAGLTAATARLAEALAVEKSLLAGAPLPGAGTGEPGRFATPLPHSAPLEPGRFAAPLPHPVPLALPPALLPSPGPLAGPPKAPGDAQAAEAAMLQSFAAQLRSTPTGVSSLMVLALAGGAFFFMLLLLWLVFG